MKLLKLIPDNTDIKFLRWRLPFYAVSLLLIAASWALVWFNGLNYGVDFAGGQEIRATFVGEAEAPVEELREGVAGIFREDEHVLEAQQQAMNDHPDHKFYNLNIDAGSMWARRPSSWTSATRSRTARTVGSTSTTAGR